MQKNNYFQMIKRLTLLLALACAIEVTAGTLGHVEKGQGARLKGQYQQAVRHFQQAIMDDPQSLDAYLGLIDLRLFQHRHTEGLTLTSLAITNHPNVLQLWLYRATLQQRQGDYSGAEEAFDRVVELAGNNQDVLQDAAQFYRKVGALDKAAALGLSQ